MPIKQRRFKLGVDLCAYCGVEACTDREDPIPRSLYPKSIRQGIQFLKIPACTACNNAKSQVDDDLRDFLTVHIYSQSHPLAIELFNDTVIRAAKSNHVRLVDRFYEGTNIGRVTPSGFLYDVVYEVPFDDEPLLEAVRWLTRGMHWAVFGESVEADSTAVRRISDERARTVALDFGDLSTKDHYVQGEPFTCVWVKEPDGGVLWAHSFYNSVLFTARTQRLARDAIMSPS